MGAWTLATPGSQLANKPSTCRHLLAQEGAAAIAGVALSGMLARMANAQMEEIGYAYRHYRGPDGRVYGLNEQRSA